MRILVVSHSYTSHLSGIPIIAENLNRQFAIAGHDVVWVASHKPTPNDHGSTTTGRVVPMQSWNVTEDFLGFPYPIWGALSLLRFEKEIARADVIHLHDGLYMGNICGSLIALLRRKPLVVTQHIGLISYRSKILRTTMGIANGTVGRFTLSVADQVVFYSLAVQQYFSGLVSFRRPPLFIANGVDRDLFYPPESDFEREVLRRELCLPLDKTTVLFVGRFVEKKGIHFMQDVCRAFPDVHFVFVGWGSIDPNAWGLNNTSVFHSQPHQSLRRFYCSADLLLLPSTGEGFPLVIQEAMTCGLPCMFSHETANGVERGHEFFLLTDLNRAAIISNLGNALREANKFGRLRLPLAQFANAEWNWKTCASNYLSAFQSILS